MLVLLVNDSCNFLTIQVIQSSSDKAESTIREVLNRRRKFEFAVKPRFNSMLIRRGNIEKVSRQHRTDVIRNDFVDQG